MAIMCREAARSLVENNSELEIICPLFRNTDIIIKKNTSIEKIAIQQSKFFHADYLYENYPDLREILQTNRTSLAYAYESDQADAVFLDIARSGSLHGIREYPSVGDTFVLVARKDYCNTSEFEEFARIYNEAVDRLNENIEDRNAQIERYTDLKEVDEENWKVTILKIPKRNSS